jgi:hypothetical protein
MPLWRPRADAASGSGRDVVARMWSHSGTAVASVPMEAVIRDPQSLLADVLEYGFHGRDWLVRRINTFLDWQQCGFVWIEAEAGVGKTAVAAYLVRERGWFSHFARYSGGRSVRGGLQNLAAQLVERFGLGEVAPRGMLPEWAFTPEGFETLLERAAIRAQAAGQKLVLVVDGADVLVTGAVEDQRRDLNRREHVGQIQVADLVDAQPDIGHQPGRRTAAGGRGELPAGRQLRPPPGEQHAHLNRRRRDPQRRPARTPGPVHLIDRALGHPPGHLVDRDLMPDLHEQEIRPQRLRARQPGAFGGIPEHRAGLRAAC